MSLDYAADHLTAALRTLATSERPLPDRLQEAWDAHVQMLWMQPCLTTDLLRELRDIWGRYTAPSDDRRSTKLRDLTHDELRNAVDDLMALWSRVTVEAARPAGERKLATLTDLA